MGEQVGRREAIRRAAVAGGVAGIVWSAPRIEGLTLRPNYASAASAGSQAWQVTFDAFHSIKSLGLVGGAGCTIISSAASICGDPAISFAFAGLFGADLDGCSINIDSVTSGTLGPGDMSKQSSPSSVNRIRGYSASDPPGFPITLSGNFICT